MRNLKIAQQMTKPQLELKVEIKEKTIKNQNTSSSSYILEEEPRVRFSDEELKEFKELILAKLDEAKIDYYLFRSALSLRDDNGTNDTSPTFKLSEDASEVSSKEETSQLAARQEKFIQHLYNALIRIENKTYGICRITGKLIAKERLRSVPHATMSIDAKQNLSDFNK